MPGKIDQRLKKLGIELPDGPTPSANYVPYVITGNLVYVSGQVSVLNGDLIAGAVGKDIDIETGQKGARACALNLIAQLRNACGGDLDRVTRVVKLGGFVNAPSDFKNSPQVMNGASDVIVEIFGDIGRHARFAVAVSSLPSGASVEVDGIFEID